MIVPSHAAETTPTRATSVRTGRRTRPTEPGGRFRGVTTAAGTVRAAFAEPTAIVRDGGTIVEVGAFVDMGDRLTSM